MGRTELFVASLICGAKLCLLREAGRTSTLHPRRAERQLRCIDDLLWMDTVDRVLKDAAQGHDEPITMSRIKDLARRGCSDCEHCTDELLEQISRGEDVWGRPLELRRVDTHDNKVLYEIRSFGKNGRKQEGRFSDDVRILTSP